MRESEVNNHVFCVPFGDRLNHANQYFFTPNDPLVLAVTRKGVVCIFYTDLQDVESQEGKGELE